jgi:hypothetical protein
MTNEINQTLAERGKRYGSFKEHARITYNIKRAMMNSPKWVVLSDDKKEALDMLANKLGRILNGDPNYIDTWRDCVGYLQLVINELQQTKGVTDSKTEVFTL